MDTLTHAMIGSAIAEAGFRSRLGRGAILAGAVFASLPDTDIFLSLSRDPVAMLRYHRAASHSLILACIAAPILGWLAYRIFSRKGSYILWSLLALLALFSHDLLDLCTTWGTEVLYPFSDRRYALDALPIIDPLIAIPLLSSFLLMLFTRKLRMRQILSGLVLCWCFIYATIGYTLSREAINLTRESAPAGFSVEKSKAIPNTGTILLWHVVLKDKNGEFYTASVSSLNQRIFNNRLYKAQTSPQIEQILNSDKFAVIRRAADDLLLAKENNTPNQITFIDMRYAMLDPAGASIPMFFFKVILDHGGKNILRVERPVPDRHKSGGIDVYLDAIFN